MSSDKNAKDMALASALRGLGKEAGMLDSVMRSAATNEKAISGMANAIKGAAAVLGMGALAGFGIKSVLDKIQNDTRRKALIDDLATTDPVLKTADKATVLRYYAAIYQAAPTVSLQKEVVRELLQNFVKFGRVDLQTMKTLVETEKSLTDVTLAPMRAFKLM